MANIDEANDRDPVLARTRDRLLHSELCHDLTITAVSGYQGSASTLYGNVGPLACLHRTVAETVQVLWYS